MLLCLILVFFCFTLALRFHLFGQPVDPGGTDTAAVTGDGFLNLTGSPHELITL